MDLGDPRYLAPEGVKAFREQLENDSCWSKGLVSTQADIWAMGATLFELLSGKIPFIYKKIQLSMGKENLIALAIAVENDELKLDSLSEELSGNARELLIQMMQKDRQKRWTAPQCLESKWFSEEGRSPLPDDVFKNIEVKTSTQRLRQILLSSLVSKLHRDHTKLCSKVFQELDSDNSGTISRHEFRKGYWKIYQGKDGLTAEEAEKRADEHFNQADIDKSGALEFHEFAALTLDWSSLTTQIQTDGVKDLVDNIGVTVTVGTEDRVDIRKLRDWALRALPHEELKTALEGLESQSSVTKVNGRDMKTVKMDDFRKYILEDDKKDRKNTSL